MNNQQAFDQVVAHLAEQGQPAQFEGSGCMYRTPDGLKCAVGALIPDELYEEEMEWQGARALIRNNAALTELFGGVSLQMLVDLQNVHDLTKVTAWADKFKEVADDYGLDSDSTKLLVGLGV